jgi:transcriptional regulator with XRE-family HTH domain
MGKALAELRKARFETQASLAKKCNMTDQTISTMEGRPDVTGGRPSTLLALAQFFGFGTVEAFIRYLSGGTVEQSEELAVSAETAQRIRVQADAEGLSPSAWLERHVAGLPAPAPQAGRSGPVRIAVRPPESSPRGQRPKGRHRANH